MGSDISIEEVGKYTDLFLGPRGPISPGISSRKQKWTSEGFSYGGGCGKSHINEALSHSKQAHNSRKASCT